MHSGFLVPEIIDVPSASLEHIGTTPLFGTRVRLLEARLIR